MPANTITYTQYGFDIGNLFGGVIELFAGKGGVEGVMGTLWTIWLVISIISFIVSALFLYVIIYARLRVEELEEIEDHHIHAAEHFYAHQDASHSKNQRWEDALRHADSDNPNDWRLAIIEADIMLEELLNTLGLPGMTIGDKLKSVSPNFMRTLDDAWKAHRTRNDIAHRGTDFVFTKRAAREAMEQYRRVFQEFEII